MDVPTLLALSLLSSTPTTPEETYLVEQVSLCSKASQPGLTRQMLRMEEHLGVPATLRGMSLAAACKESRFNPSAKGDHGRAVGILQQWPWWEKKYRIHRVKAPEAAASWLIHVAAQVPKVQKQCGPLGEQQMWIAAWVTAIRAPRKGGRCQQLPKHLGVLKAWQRAVRQT